MAVMEVVSSGDRRSLVQRFERKSKQQAVSELVDIHLTHCTRAEKLEGLLREVLSEVPHGWGASFSESELAEKIRQALPADGEP
jgi:hypothetical protein